MAAIYSPDDFNKEWKKATKWAGFGLLSQNAKAMINAAWIGWLPERIKTWHKQYLINKGRSATAGTAIQKTADKVAGDIYSDAKTGAYFDLPGSLLDLKTYINCDVNLHQTLGGRWASFFHNDLRSKFGAAAIQFSERALNVTELPKDLVNWSKQGMHSSGLSAGFDREITPEANMRYQQGLMDHMKAMLRYVANSETAIQIKKDGQKLGTPIKKNVDELFYLFQLSVGEYMAQYNSTMLRRAGTSGQFMEVMIQEFNDEYKNLLYKDGKRHWGFVDYMANRKSKSMQNLDQVYQALFSGRAVDFKVVDGELVKYDRKKAKSLNAAFGCDNNRFGAATAAANNRKFIIDTFINGVSKDDFSTMDLRDTLRKQYRGEFKKGENGKMGKERPSEMEMVFMRALRMENDPTWGEEAREKWELKSSGLSERAMFWISKSNEDIFNDYIEERQLAGASIAELEELRYRRDQVVDGTRRMRIARDAASEYVSHAQNPLIEISAPDWSGDNFGAGGTVFSRGEVTIEEAHYIQLRRYGLTRDAVTLLSTGKVADGRTMLEVYENSGALSGYLAEDRITQLNKWAESHKDVIENNYEARTMIDQYERVFYTTMGGAYSDQVMRDGIKEFAQFIPKIRE